MFPVRLNLKPYCVPGLGRHVELCGRQPHSLEIGANLVTPGSRPRFTFTLMEGGDVNLVTHVEETSRFN